MPIIKAVRFQKGYYGQGSDIAINSLEELQDVDFSLVNTDSIEQAVKDAIQDYLRDEKLCANLLANINERFEGFALLQETPAKYALMVYSDFIINVGENAVTLPAFEFCLIEIIKL